MPNQVRHDEPARNAGYIVIPYDQLTLVRKTARNLLDAWQATFFVEIPFARLMKWE